MQDFSLLVPEFALTGLAFLVLGIDLVLPNKRANWLPGVTIVGLLVIGICSPMYLMDRGGSLYDGAYMVDEYGVFFKTLFPSFGAIAALMSVTYVKRRLTNHGEFYALLIFTVLAMQIMAGAGELLTAYISLELLSFCLYVLVSYARNEAKSNEAGIKYVLLGAFSTALLLYGISLIYTSLGTTYYSGIREALLAGDGAGTPFSIGLILVISGLGFKIAAVPFHMWAPDVYEGAPTPVTAYIAVAAKAGAFVLFLRIFAEAFAPAAGQFGLLLALLAALTMTVGNLVALTQSNIKRLLAYSSIGQAGYLLMAIAAFWMVGEDGGFVANALAANGLIFHVIGYGITNFLAFFCVIVVSLELGKDSIQDYSGLASRTPVVAAALGIAFFSLAGLPFFVGFTSKFYLFAAVAEGGYFWLAGVGIVNSLISLYYYLVVIRRIYLEQPADSTPIRLNGISMSVLVVLVGCVIFLGVYPSPLMDTIQHAASSIFPQ